MGKRPEKIVHQPIDYVGLSLLVIGVGLLQVVLDKGNDLDWFESTFIQVGGAVAVVALIALVIWELTDKHPIVNLSLFRYRNFSFGTLALVLGYSGFFGINLLLPQWLQTQLGYTPVWAGLAAAPIGLLPVFLSPLVGRFAHKVDMRLLSGGSFLVIGASCFMRATFNTEVDYRHIAEVQVFMGLGIALFFMPTTSILLSSLPPKDIADGSGLATFLRVLGGSFASSLTTWIWQRRADLHHAQLAEHVTAYDPATQQYLQQLGGASTAHYAQIDKIVESQAYMLSTVEYFTLLGWMFFGLILIIWLAKPPFTAKAAGGGGH